MSGRLNEPYCQTILKLYFFIVAANQIIDTHRLANEIKESGNRPLLVLQCNIFNPMLLLFMGIFRLGEIYLNYAEAAIELNKQGDALWAVNEIRKRAGMPELPAVTREDVRKERKIELAYEGTRYFDVRRWRTAKEELTKSYHGLRYILDGPSMVEGQYDVLSQKFKLIIVDDVSGIPNPYFDEKHYYLPISLSRTSNNNKLVENPGYQ